MSQFTVDRCVCHDVLFEDMLPIIKDSSISQINEKESIKLLCERTSCTSGCGLCEPYIKHMIRTGQTKFIPLQIT